ncbi:MAG: MotA/TolQ/ExbB proton channel family protein [Methyloceanibacter sp.]|uniref:MotA/TolQ/ExbB proton channel family protein n=1 Tax=Methyloceanibacter sp. TaxID=1965321 RepID=UPI003D6CEB6E
MSTLAGPDYSVWGLVMQADPVVKGVMLILVLASVACWAIIFEKLVSISWLNRSIRRLAVTRDSRERGGLVSKVLEAGEREADTDLDDTPAEKRQRIEGAMRLTLKSQLQQIETGLPFLATIGSAAPFIGLFGTVWGIVNSFTAIAQQKDTSLAVVAPGIAEALIATALGLAAAIPAVMAYNQFAVALGRAYARGNSSIIEIAREFVAEDARGDGRRPRATNVEPIRAGKHS